MTSVDAVATPVDVAALSLATWRLTALVVSDTITARPRRVIAARLRRSNDEPIHPLVVLAFCGRCLSVWMAAAVTAGYAAVVHLSFGRWLLWWWAVAGAAALLDRWDTRSPI